MAKVFSESNTMYKDGFITRLRNRRIVCWKKGKFWYMKFIRFTMEDMSKYANHFDVCINRMGGYITESTTKISEEAFINLTHMGFSYFNPAVKFIYEESRPKKKLTKPKKN